MSLTPQLDRYLSVRRSLGYDLRTDERLLRRFARFADQEACSAHRHGAVPALGGEPARCGHIDAIGQAQRRCDCSRSG